MKNLFANLFPALNREKVRYLVVGGVAVNLYGIERATGDLIALKTGTGRPQDESDIYFLSQLQEGWLKKG